MDKLTFEACMAGYQSLLAGSPANSALAIGRGRCVVLGSKGLFGARRGKSPAEQTAFALEAKDWDAERGCWIGENPEDTARFIERPIFVAIVRQADLKQAKKAEKTWGAQRYEHILQEARERYGKGWDHMSADARENFIASRVLYLMLGQADEKYTPAHDLVRQVFAAKSAAEAS